MSNRLRVVTLNTWKCDGDYDARCRWMAAGLCALEPDIVFLQEAFVCPSTGDDTAAHLANSLCCNVVQLPGREKRRRHRDAERPSWSNLAILSRIAAQPLLPEKLLDCAGDSDRWIQMAEVTAFGAPLRLCNTHFTHIPGAPGDLARQHQAAQLGYAASPPAAGLTIFGGDLNATPVSAAIRHLMSLSDRVLPETDAVTATLQGASVDAVPDGQTLDYIFLRKGHAAPAMRYTRQWTALDVPIGPEKQFPSDHAAVVADLTVTSSAAI